MKAKSRLLWMKLHAYFACFFLPITLVYIISGVLYLFDIKGGTHTQHEYPLLLSEGWPTSQSAAERLVIPTLTEHEHASLPPDYFPEETLHDWYGFKHEVILKQGDLPTEAVLIVKEHDFVHQMLLIHKGFAGELFWLFGIMLGLSLAFSLISGVVITLQLPQLKTPSVLAIIGGTGVLLVAFF